MKVTLVTTILNEQKTIVRFFEGIFNQSVLPDQVIIIDGGSSDRTLDVIQNKLSEKPSALEVIVLKKKGNRSVGRNEGISKASHDNILLTDAGCILDKDWVKEISQPFTDPTVDVVAGYYNAIPQNIFQKSLVPYVLVMPDRVDPFTFLPATRSMAIRKKVWKEVGGFNEELSHNEDYEFARRLRAAGKSIFFARQAIVSWIPRTSLSEAFTMFYRFAFGDAEAGIIRPKVVLLFVRYTLLISLLLLVFLNQQGYLLFGLFGLVLLYCGWAVAKNYRYVLSIQALFFLPLIQITADLAVMKGSVQGFFKRYGI